MDTKSKLAPAANASDWMNAHFALVEFTDIHPQFGISQSRASTSRVLSEHHDSLVKAGALCTVKRVHLANKQKFATALVAALTEAGGQQ